MSETKDCRHVLSLVGEVMGLVYERQMISLDVIDHAQLEALVAAEEALSHVPFNTSLCVALLESIVQQLSELHCPAQQGEFQDAVTRPFKAATNGN